MIRKRFFIDGIIFRRGRTTTGIVTACLLKMIVGDYSLLDRKQVGDWGRSVSPVSASTTDDDRLRHRYLGGEYKIILHLIGALENGRLSKSLTDRAIDCCDQVQNLRKAIYDYKLRVEALEPGSKKVKNGTLNLAVKNNVLFVDIC